MRLHFVGSFILAATCLFVSGCESVATRIASHESVYNQLDRDTQSRLRHGEIKAGDSFDLVYIALGAPDENTTSADPDGSTTTLWTYHGRGQRTAKEETVGYQQDAETNVQTGERIVHEVPIREKVYGKSDTSLQVVFRNGTATGVRYVKPVILRPTPQ